MVAKKKVLSLKKKSTKVALKSEEVSVEKKSDKNIFIKSVLKRDGTTVPFDLNKITNAINKAMLASGEGSIKDANIVADKVFNEIVKIAKKYKNFMPTVEGVQDTVEQELMLSDFVKTSKNYILYREERARLRSHSITVPERVKKLNDESKKYFRNPLSEFVYYRSYAKWIEEEGRRETWIETISRYVEFMKGKLGDKLKESEYEEVREAILKQEAMPSMRLLQFAGPAAEKTNVCAYNCSFIAPSKFQDFGEIIYISMCGTGVGFSVESKNIQALPQIKNQSGKKLPTFVVPDTKEGWADAFVLGMKTWFDGNDIEFDFSLLRPAGARLKIMGGKSSGPKPLIDLLGFTRDRILRRQGRHLRNIDAHDIICKIGECVVSGGVRRSALISLSDLDDSEMRDAKNGQFWLNEGQRMLANNSAVYNVKPTETEFLKEWIALMESGSGERGIFNRGSLYKSLPKRRIEKSADFIGEMGTNPCGEIILRSKQFCNLSEVVARAEDTEESLLRKIRIATIIGTYQSTLTKFGYLSKEWKDNCDAEKLLGVSVTGQWDSKIARDPAMLTKLRLEAIRVNKVYAKRFGINESTCITAVKPSGTVSQTVDCASGMHPRHAPYYIRRIRISATDSLFKMMKDQGVPYHPEVGQTLDEANTFVLEFPMKAPEDAICKDDITAIDQLEHWKVVKVNYTEHNPSVTVSVGENEWIQVAHWLYQNWDIVGGLSFLPRSNHVYQLAPYEAIDEKTYKDLVSKMPDFDFSKIVTYEMRDETEVKRELACVSGVCDIV
ncbi:TPA: ribonucleoside-triphosphate reductase [Candidatus Nomurabacteria bacterium]|nr:MAG: Ribonucleoside-triphosphate reductase [Candidatus Nomurabacteria bacterium GW2011_GWD2_36_14]KKP99208.1 MAG: Ribonucleoside-triphosphate reductase [Candidatus Nomurabacteria bacterium GW2011_GWF2_36_19]KKQ12599.1 MAG: Ribonucleoside-triphosphate reductase [Candidatus Nomurabacteria bacterium GW2011_GWE1_36_71]KKQ44110.1 MAG: Ribonucleoside-triphosphate reductase [Candidatus Nomurabacteria bacterium GW2011_GWC1_37_9]HAQ02309.1 ribonucleoside-triphosphate reductase [Candidatus Nomurabacte